MSKTFKNLSLIILVVWQSSCSHFGGQGFTKGSLVSSRCVDITAPGKDIGIESIFTRSTDQNKALVQLKTFNRSGGYSIYEYGSIADLLNQEGDQGSETSAQSLGFAYTEGKAFFASYESDDTQGSLLLREPGSNNRFKIMIPGADELTQISLFGGKDFSILKLEKNTEGDRSLFLVQKDKLIPLNFAKGLEIELSDRALFLKKSDQFFIVDMVYRGDESKGQLHIYNFGADYKFSAQVLDLSNIVLDGNYGLRVIKEKFIVANYYTIENTDGKSFITEEAFELGSKVKKHSAKLSELDYLYTSSIVASTKSDDVSYSLEWFDGNSKIVALKSEAGKISKIDTDLKDLEDRKLMAILTEDDGEFILLSRLSEKRENILKLCRL